MLRPRGRQRWGKRYLLRYAAVGAPGDFTEIDEAVELLAETLLSHLAYEEREITEPLSRFGFYAGQI